MQLFWESMFYQNFRQGFTSEILSDWSELFGRNQLWPWLPAFIFSSLFYRSYIQPAIQFHYHLGNIQLRVFYPFDILTGKPVCRSRIVLLKSFARFHRSACIQLLAYSIRNLFPCVLFGFLSNIQFLSPV